MRFRKSLDERAKYIMRLHLKECFTEKIKSNIELKSLSPLNLLYNKKILKHSR